MGSQASPKPHAVLVPYPAQGHINPLMQLAKLLYWKGFHITYVNTEYNHRRLKRSKGLDFADELEGFTFEAIPDGLPPSDRDATQHIPTLSDSIAKNNLKNPFAELMKKLDSNPDLPPVTCVMSDAIMGFAREVAVELGVPEVQFWTASACGYMAYIHFDELAKQGIVPFKDDNFLVDGTLDKPIEWLPGMPNMKLRDIPTFIRTTDPNDIMFNYLGGQSRRSLHSAAILINTFDEFEHEVLKELNKMHPNIYTAGPLNMLLARHVSSETKIKSFSSSLWNEDTNCLNWLDKWEPESVVYVNYGCVTTMTDQHLKEFAWGLAKSKQPFLWIVRPDVVMGESSSAAALPKEFYDEVEDRGMIVSWCPQAEVLKHPSIGAYLSHCGWNSTTESVAGGVPMLCWPFFAEQSTNCRYACTVWGTGMEVNHDVKRDEVAELVKEMMEGEKGKVLRENAKEWRRKAEGATEVGGSAYNNFERLVKDILRFKE
ncbi:unnamed protein product [Rhodiola kirilowii]